MLRSRVVLLPAAATLAVGALVLAARHAPLNAASFQPPAGAAGQPPAGGRGGGRGGAPGGRGGAPAGGGGAAPTRAPADPNDHGLESSTGLVVSEDTLGSDIGAAILRKGGNAVDAAVATAFALAVTHPDNGNIGGGGFMMIRTTDGKVHAIDFREKAPLKSTPTMYLDPATGKLRSPLPTSTGYLAPGVPGTVAGMYLAQKTYGKLPWKDVVMPAANLAKGFVRGGLATSLNGNTHGTGSFTPYPASVAAYIKPGGGMYAPTDTIRLPDLAHTLTEIANKGQDVFYKGWIADSMAADMARHGGLITKEDLAQYKPAVREPIHVTYRGYDVYMMPPSSGGGVILAEVLNTLENFNLRAMGQTSPAAVHTVIEAMQRAFLDRGRYLGDPDFNPDMPLATLTSKAYGKALAQSIDPNHHIASEVLGKDILTVPIHETESMETTHFSTMDKDGMAVATTYTLEGGWGSKVVVPGAGFILNNEMGDFNKVPGVGMKDNINNIGTAPNLIAPGKRMLSSMTPTIVQKNGKLVLVTGSPGSKTIPSTVLGVLLAVMDYGATNARQAVDAPRIDHEWMADQATVETNATPAIPQSTIDALTAMGTTVRQGGGGSAHSIFIDSNGLATAANDRRQAGSYAAK